MKILKDTSFGMMFLASLGGIIADTHAFFPVIENYIVGLGIFIGMVLSIKAVRMFLGGK